jgi:hypothetical protein
MYLMRLRSHLIKQGKTAFTELVTQVAETLPDPANARERATE